MSSYIQQYVTQNKKIKKASYAIVLTILLSSVLLSSTVFADTMYEVKPGDSLSKIVAKNYPDVAKQSHDIIMQYLLEKNPDAFSKKNINSLRVGKTLRLIDKEKIQDLKPELVTVTSKTITATIFKKLQEENKSLQKQIKELKAKLASNKQSSSQIEQKGDEQVLANNAKLFEDLKEANKKIADLQTQIEQLNALVDKYEKEQKEASQSAENTATSDGKSVEDLKTELEQLRSLVTKYEADQEDADAQIQKLQEQLKAVGANPQTEDTADTASTSNDEIANLQAEIESLKQENTILKEQLDAAKTQSSQDTATIKQLQDQLATNNHPSEAKQVASNTATTPQKSSGSGLAIFSWLLPLLTILIGLYLLLRLIKRMRDKKATEEFKAAMVTTASANTATAFGIDGSAPAPYQEVHSNNNGTSSNAIEEEDSLEAAVKLNIAKAYFELQDQEAANEILQEVMIEGSRKQKEEAEKLVQ